MDALNPWWLTGQIEGDKDDFVLSVEPGARQYNNDNMANGQLPAQDQPDKRPIEGVS